MTRIRIATRKSKLAMWQTQTVAALLEKEGMVGEISSMDTRGDKILDTTIAKIGSKGVFTEELEEQLAQGLTDIAVHSAKDMQSSLPEGFELIAFSQREQANDVLVSHNTALRLDKPDTPLKIGTSSVRRIALLKRYYPHVETVQVRGNLQTRIAKMENGDCDALMLAYAGVVRMGYEHMIVHSFPKDEFIPPVGQGCIAVEASFSLASEKKARIRKAVNDPISEDCLLAERAFLRKLEGGCSIPAFGHAVIEGDTLILSCGLSSLDGKTLIQRKTQGPRSQATVMGESLGEEILQAGGRELLDKIKREQQR